MSLAAGPDATRIEPGQPQLPRLPVAAWAGAAVLAIICLLGIFGGLLAPHQVGQIVGTPYQPPGAQLLGTDVLGRDVLSRLLLGAQLTLLISFASTAIGFVIGVTIGFTAAELRGQIDAIVVWILDIVLGIPPLMLGLLIIAGLTPGLWVLIGTIALIHLPRIARVSRSVALNITTLQFVEVARVRGEKLPAILLREILPNCLRPLAVEFGMRFTYSVLFASDLSFLGLGIQPPLADWGMMLRENLDAMQVGVYWPLLAPGALIGLLAVSVNLLVDALGGKSAQAIPDELR